MNKKKTASHKKVSNMHNENKNSRKNFSYDDGAAQEWYTRKTVQHRNHN